MGLIAAGVETNIINRPGGIFLRAADQISNEDRILIQTVARVIISDKRGTLAEQINHRSLTDVEVPHIKPIRKSRTRFPEEAVILRNDLVFFNGLGGFTGDGREYVIIKSHEQVTPAPWLMYWQIRILGRLSLRMVPLTHGPKTPMSSVLLRGPMIR